MIIYFLETEKIIIKPAKNRPLYGSSLETQHQKLPVGSPTLASHLKWKNILVFMNGKDTHQQCTS